MCRDQMTRSLFVGCRLGLGLVTILMAIALSIPSPASGYDYGSDVENLATVDSARRILSQTGAIFIEPEVISQYFHVSPQLPYRLPFTERELWDCGQCVLFPAVTHIGYRQERTSILQLWRAPETKRLFRRTQSLVAPWFKDESWAKEPLALRWHLVRLEMRGKGDPPQLQGFYQDHERSPSPNVAFWMLLLIPEYMFTGEAFFTDETTRGGNNIVTIGRTERETIHIDHTPQEIGNKGVGRIVEIIPKR